MKKFRFNLEALLKLRDWEEQRSRSALGLAAQEVERLRARIDELSQDQDRAFSAWDGTGSQTFTPADRAALVNQVSAIRGSAEQAAAELKDALERRKAAMAQLVAASRQKRVVESLKTRRQEEHRVEAFRAETLEIEDIFNARRKERMYS